MNNSQNYIAEKSVFPPKIVTDFSETSDKEQRVANQDNSVNHKPSGTCKIFYESNLNPTDSQVEKNFKSVKKKRCRDGPVLEISEDVKRLRKNLRRTQPEIEKQNTKPSNVPGVKPRVLLKTLEESEKPENKPGPNFLLKNNLANLHKNTFQINTLKTDQKFPSNITHTKPGPIIEENSSEVIKPKVESIFSKGSNISRKPSVRCPKRSFIKPIISDVGKRRINEILKGHAQKVVRQRASIVRDPKVAVAEKPNLPDLKEEVEIKNTVLVANTEVKVEKPENSKLEEKNSKIVEKSSKIGENKSKELKKGKEDPKGKEPGTEQKKKLPVTWANVPQSKELERRLKTSEAASLFLSGKNQKADDHHRTGDDKKLKAEDKSGKKSAGQKAKADTDKGDEKKDKRETYTDRLVLLKLLGKDLEDKKKAIEVNEEFQRVTNVEKPPREHTPKKGVSSRGLLSNNIIKPITPKEMVLIQERKETSPVSPIKVEKIFEVDQSAIIKPKQTRSAELRDLVTQAIKDHKIFCVFDNHTYIVRPVREELLNRGWLEIIPDRRLIPRRRPPPMAPVLEKTPDRISVERNWNTLEAILTAKQHFADEIQETVSRSSSFKYTIEKPKTIATAINATRKKISQESIPEVKSQFAIIPPNYERKKTNVDIRDFVAKYNAILERVKDRENDIKRLKEKEKNAKMQKKEKAKASNEASKPEEPVTPVQGSRPPLSTKKSIQKIAESIKDNNMILRTVVTGIDNFEEKAGGNLTIGVLYEKNQKGLPAIKNKEAQEQEKKQEKPPPENAVKNSFTENEARTISKIIQSANARIHFMWLSIKPAIHLKCFNYSPEIINKFQRTTFCTKIGLWSHLSNIQWYAHEVSYPAKSPRMYNTGEADDLQAFFQDFQITACIGMLKWISDTFFEKGLKGVHAKKGKVPLKAFEFAIKQCEKYIKYKENEDLTAYEDFNVLEDEWNTFLQWFYSITNDHGKVQESSTAQLMVVYTRAAETLKIMRRYWPEIDIDGRLNIWIMKPYCASCGRGIFMTNNVYYIGQHSKYIVQKYIEKPLLIYNTKFDIRQWFMITKLTPLEIWMYKECYLRFCTQPFALRNLHESVHLSNNSVQRKYICARDQSLPDQNMWDSKTFQLYLRTIGQPSVWDEIIYPGMRDAIVSTMLAAQETFDGPRKSWFEVYGADFMLSSNLKDGPWLIEINENPAMDPSTKVTARLCPQMLRDVIKVVVDKRANRNANTGQWELVYRQNYSPSYGIVNLDVRGKKIARTPNPVKISPDYQRGYITDKKYPEDFGYTKLYEFGNSFGGSHNQSSATNYFEKIRNRRKIIQLKKGHEQEQASKMTAPKLLKNFERQIAHETWGYANLKVKDFKSDNEKEVIE